MRMRQVSDVPCAGTSTPSTGGPIGAYAVNCGAPVTMRFKFVPRDCWIGVYWDDKRIYICILPCLPLVIDR